MSRRSCFLLLSFFNIYKMRETQIHAYSKGKASREKTLENRGEKNEKLIEPPLRR